MKAQLSLLALLFGLIGGVYAEETSEPSDSAKVEASADEQKAGEQEKSTEEKSTEEKKEEKSEEKGILAKLFSKDEKKDEASEKKESEGSTEGDKTTVAEVSAPSETVASENVAPKADEAEAPKE